MAESDCNAHEIMSVSGHSSLREVERYTRAFDRKKLAARAQAKVAAANNVVPLAVAANAPPFFQARRGVVSQDADPTLRFGR